MYVLHDVTWNEILNRLNWCTLLETYSLICFVIAFEKMNFLLYCIYIQYNVHFILLFCLVSINCYNLFFSTQSFSKNIQLETEYKTKKTHNQHCWIIKNSVFECLFQQLKLLSAQLNHTCLKE